MELTSSLPIQIVIGLIIMINVVAFVVMGRDKQQAIRGHDSERIPEGVLFFLATVFGSVGIYLGMMVWRHKIRKWYFQIGIPFLALQHLLLGWQFFV